MNVVGVVTLGKLIEAHRDSDEQKFKTYVEFIAEAYEQQGNDRGARIIRNSYTGGGKDTAKVILDAASPDEQDVAVYYETGNGSRSSGTMRPTARVKARVLYSATVRKLRTSTISRCARPGSFTTRSSTTATA